jgi:hypothetical protein
MAAIIPDECSSKPLGVLVKAVTSTLVVPLTLTIDGEVPIDLGVCTRVLADQRVLAQFQNTFDSFIYITPFGDAPGQVVIEFLINNCRPECGGASIRSGMALDVYQRRLLPNMQDNPIVTICIGNLPLRGCLTGMRVSGSVDGSPMIRAELMFTGWPA